MPRAVSTPEATDAGRRKFIESSAVVYGVAGGSVVWIAHPSGPSASTARTPPWISPGGDNNHGDAGIVNVVRPGPASTGSMPVRWLIGGRGATPSTKPRTCSIPVRAKKERSG